MFHEDIYKYIGKGYCYACASYYPISEMNADKSKRRGHRSICSFCKNKANRLANGLDWVADSELREIVMSETLPLYHRRLEFIKKCKLNIDNPEDTGKIDIVLELNGLGRN